MSLAPEHPAPPVLPEVPEGVTPTDPDPRWPAPMALAAFVTAILTAALFGSIVLLAAGDTDDPPAWANVVAALIQDVAFVVLALVFAAMVARPRPWQFGLRRTRFWAAAGWSLLAYVVFVGLSYAFLTAVNATDEPDDLPQDLGVDESTAALLAIGFVVCVLAPLVEEFFFRGYLYGSFRRIRGPWLGALIVGILFGAVHAGGSDPAYLLPLAIFGGVLCLLRERTGSLYPCIVLHAINNCLAFGRSVDWTWQQPVSIVVSLALIALVLRAVTRSDTSVPAAVRIQA